MKCKCKKYLNYLRYLYLYIYIIWNISFRIIINFYMIRDFKWRKRKERVEEE